MQRNNKYCTFPTAKKREKRIFVEEEKRKSLNRKRMKKNLVILTGAGMSAESGISTFRDAGGLWEQYPVEQVATPRRKSPR